jgi:hypothetical protein
MTESENFLPYIEIVEDFLHPLFQATEDLDSAEALIRELGYAPPSQLLAFNELNDITTAVSSLCESLRSALNSDNKSEFLIKLVEIMPEIGRAVRAINDFHNKIQQNFAGSDFLLQTDILTSIPAKLMEYLVVKYLEDYQPVLFATLLIVGVIEIEDVEDVATIYNIPYRKRAINWDGLSSFLSDPIGRVKANLDGGDEFLYDRLLYLLFQMGLALGLLPIFGAPKANLLTILNQGTDVSGLDESEELNTLYFPVIRDPLAGVGFDVYPLVDPASKKYSGLALALSAGAQFEISLSDEYKMQIKANAEIRDGLGVRINKNGNISFVSSLISSPTEFASATSFGIKFSIVPTELGTTRKLLSIGAPAGTLFEIGSGSLSFGIEKLDELNIFIEANLKDGLLSIKAEEADGFISKILPAEGITSMFELGIGVSNRAGLYFTGTSGLIIQIPLHIELGPINIDNLNISFGFENDQYPLTITSGLSLTLGPLAVVVEDIGVRAVFKVKSDRPGNAGPLNIDFGFKPPKGIGLSIDAGVVKGAGYLFIDVDRGEYAGALELTFSDFLSLKAIGLINTKMPDGSKGFSLLIIITAEFTIQLGMGFVFLGAGGLLGLHRTAKLTPLAEGVRSGATANILFPTNVVENATKIISDIKVFFPIQQNHFLIGPMIKLGYGQPALISLALGIIIEIRTNEGGGIERIAILGVLKCILPEEQAAILILQVNFIGAVDFTTKTGFFFASVFESRILAFTIEGEMGVLIAWGSDSNFILSVGGFHPAFNPPPLPFPVPKRMALSILNESWGKIRVEGYFAITTNTVQFGAKIEVFFGISDFCIDGHLAFDALFQFSPFYFIVEISGKVSLKVCGVGLFSISLNLSLEGPTPWRAKGKGKIKILFFSFSASFDKTWGNDQDTTLPPIEVIPILLKEFGNSQNWEAIAPVTNGLLVSLRKLPESTDQNSDQNPAILVLHPLGNIKVSQRAVPLDIRIDKVGNQKPSDGNEFDLEIITNFLESAGDVKESFAPAQFFEMSNSKKLDEPATRKYNSGKLIRPAGSGTESKCSTTRHARYELITIDTGYKRTPPILIRLHPKLFGAFLRNNAAARSLRSDKLKRESQPFREKINVKEGSFTVAYSNNNMPYSGQSSGFANLWEAEAFLNNNTQVADQLHVIPANEVNEFAL